MTVQHIHKKKLQTMSFTWCSDTTWREPQQKSKKGSEYKKEHKKVTTKKDRRKNYLQKLSAFLFPRVPAAHEVTVTHTYIATYSFPFTPHTQGFSTSPLPSLTKLSRSLGLGREREKNWNIIPSPFFCCTRWFGSLAKPSSFMLKASTEHKKHRT